MRFTLKILLLGFLLDMGISFGAEPGTEPSHVEKKDLADPFSHKYETSLSVAASLSASSGLLTVGIKKQNR